MELCLVTVSPRQAEGQQIEFSQTLITVKTRPALSGRTCDNVALLRTLVRACLVVVLQHLKSFHDE